MEVAFVVFLTEHNLSTVSFRGKWYHSAKYNILTEVVT